MSNTEVFAKQDGQPGEPNELLRPVFTNMNKQLLKIPKQPGLSFWSLCKGVSYIYIYTEVKAISTKSATSKELGRIPAANCTQSYLFSASSLSIRFHSRLTKDSCSCSRAFSSSTFSRRNWKVEKYRELKQTWNAKVHEMA